MPHSSARNVTPEARVLRERIRAAGLNFVEFGRLAGLTRNRVYKLLTVQQPSPDVRKRIDQVLSAALKRAR
jgi:hypothetical protein